MARSKDERRIRRGTRKEVEAGLKAQDQVGKGLLLQTSRALDDMQMIRRAIRDDWPVPAEFRKKLTQRLNDLIEDEDISPDILIQAGRTMIAADSVNVRREAMDQADEHAKSGKGGINVNIGVNADGPVQIYLPDNGRALPPDLSTMVDTDVSDSIP